MRRALDLDPNYPEANCGLGAILLRQDKTIEEFLQAMREAQRLIYEFDVKNAYWLH